MGIAEEIGKKLNKIHRPHLDWKLLLLIIILMGFSIFISFIKEPLGNDSYIGSSIIYMLLGLGLSIGIYFYDYKKLKKHSISVYLIATVILILPILGVGYRMMGIPCIRIFGISLLTDLQTRYESISMSFDNSNLDDLKRNIEGINRRLKEILTEDLSKILQRYNNENNKLKQVDNEHPICPSCRQEIEDSAAREHLRNFFINEMNKLQEKANELFPNIYN